MYADSRPTSKTAAEQYKRPSPDAAYLVSSQQSSEGPGSRARLPGFKPQFFQVPSYTALNLYGPVSLCAQKEYWEKLPPGWRGWGEGGEAGYEG